MSNALQAIFLPFLGSDFSLRRFVRRKTRGIRPGTTISLCALSTTTRWLAQSGRPNRIAKLDGSLLVLGDWKQEALKTVRYAGEGAVSPISNLCRGCGHV